VSSTARFAVPKEAISGGPPPCEAPGLAHLFPREFADLEAVASAWALDSYDERHQKRLQSSIEELETFYVAVLPRAKDIMAYCAGFDILNAPEEVRALLNVLGSLVDVSLSIEEWRQVNRR
jgi:hypothetical protein